MALLTGCSSAASRFSKTYLNDLASWPGNRLAFFMPMEKPKEKYPGWNYIVARETDKAARGDFRCDGTLDGQKKCEKQCEKCWGIYFSK